MISRQWRGLARPDMEAAYEEHLQTETFPAIRKIDGFVDATIPKRPVASGVEFLIVTRWKTMDAIAQFAGDDAEVAVVPTNVQGMMVEYDARVRHYQVVEESAGPLPSAVLFVRDVRSLSRFYQDVASMRAIHDDEDHVVLEIPGFQLVIHALRAGPSSRRASEGKVVAREDSHWKLCLPVESIARARVRAAELGGLIKAPEHEWTARGFRACDGHDPEGNVLQLRESAGEGA